MAGRYSARVFRLLRKRVGYVYVTYGYYVGKFAGEMPEDLFLRNERKAESFIRSITYMHGDIFSVERDEIKDAVCAVADVFYLSDKGAQSRQSEKKSENTDGYSVTYVTEQTDGQTREELMAKKAYAAAYPYLLPLGWLSRSVRRC